MGRRAAASAARCAAQGSQGPSSPRCLPTSRVTDERSKPTTAAMAATASLTVRESPEPAAGPVAATANDVPSVPRGILVAALGACVLTVAAVVGVVTRKHEA